MFKVIKGKRYDTETARCIGKWDNGIYGNDFNSMSEDLYRTKSGNFFLHCQGGPLTPYAVSCGNNLGWGEVIKPMSEEDTRAWAEMKLSGEEYEIIFGMVEDDEDNEVAQISASIPKAIKEKMDAMREETGETLSEFLTRLIKGC